jgi:hypothetical protein
MPLSRVYESFDPRERKFDVVIIDEASQSDVSALAALYLGREHVVVGDKEQVTPDAVGQNVDQVTRLISTDLQGIPNSHLYDGQTSIYDLAETAFGGVVALREHFRCVPEIIQFSNHLSYSQGILPLREPNSAAVGPALVAHRVGGRRDGKNTNSIEAEEVASLVVACLQDPSYATNRFGRPMSFGWSTPIFVFIRSGPWALVGSIWLSKDERGAWPSNAMASDGTLLNSSMTISNVKPCSNALDGHLSGFAEVSSSATRVPQWHPFSQSSTISESNRWDQVKYRTSLTTRHRWLNALDAMPRRSEQSGL